MNTVVPFKLAKPPIIEAVVDIECTMPPGFDLAAVEKLAAEKFKGAYPKHTQQHVEEHRFEAAQGSAPKMSVRHGLQALQFRQNDDKQLIQVRSQGYSFNRLTPYGSLDDYLREIERTWTIFRELTSPTQIRVVRLRYINRLDLPMVQNKVHISDYIKDAPDVPPDTQLSMRGFLVQRLAIDDQTGHEANIVLSSQPPQRDAFPVIFDICVGAPGPKEPENWTWISETIISLRGLKNRIFQNSLTEKCLNLYRH